MFIKLTLGMCSFIYLLSYIPIYLAQIILFCYIRSSSVNTLLVLCSAIWMFDYGASQHDVTF